MIELHIQLLVRRGLLSLVHRLMFQIPFLKQIGCIPKLDFNFKLKIVEDSYQITDKTVIL